MKSSSSMQVEKKAATIAGIGQQQQGHTATAEVGAAAAEEAAIEGRRGAAAAEGKIRAAAFTRLGRGQWRLGWVVAASNGWTTRAGSKGGSRSGDNNEGYNRGGRRQRGLQATDGVGSRRKQRRNRGIAAASAAAGKG
ncbi:hypothetical protein GW17_00013664 [Ensete ventricosum]|nr:hypothetical protein GW17_00013664 [Ensete ventricosum]